MHKIMYGHSLDPPRALHDNFDDATVSGFGFEWSHFTQNELSADERHRYFEQYFSIFPWELLSRDGGIGADIGCGSGRWSLLVAPKVARLHLIDASPDAVAVARENLAGMSNLDFHCTSVERLPFPDGSLDFAFSLGVLTFVPDPAAAIQSLANKLKPNAPLLLYMYYAFENRPIWYRALWRATDFARRLISCLPPGGRYGVSQVAAATLYWPLACMARVLFEPCLL